MQTGLGAANTAARSNRKLIRSYRLMNNCTTHSIYRIVCFANGKVYIGQSQNPTLRKKKHITLLRSGKHHSLHLQQAFDKYGENSFYFEVLESDVSKKDVDTRESYWIDHFDSYRNGFNRTEGGRVGGVPGEKCFWNGVEYKSIADAARANNISAVAMGVRIRNGYAYDSDIPDPHEGIACVWNGIQYSSLNDAAKANGTTHTAMHERIQKGYTCDADIPYCNRASCTWNGVTYPSITAAATANGITKAAMLRRLKRGQCCDTDMKQAERRKLNL